MVQAVQQVLQQQVLPEGAVAPDFTAQSTGGQQLSLSAALKSGPAMIVFAVQMDLDVGSTTAIGKDFVIDGKSARVANKRLDQYPARDLSIEPLIKQHTVSSLHPPPRTPPNLWPISHFIGEKRVLVTAMPRFDDKRQRPIGHRWQVGAVP